MAFLVKDRVQETCSSPGTGTISLLGAVTGFQTFSSAIGNTNTTFYTIADQTGANWEVGLGTYSTTGNTLARTTVLASSNGGSLTNFSSGTQNVWCDYPAGKAVLLDPAGKLLAGGQGYVDYASVQPALAAGRMWYDGTTGSWNLGMGGGNITQQVGEELYVYGKASAAITGNTLLQAIYQTGVVGASGVISFAPTVAGITNGQLIIGVGTEDIALNGFGRINSWGIVHGVDTTGSTYSETWADGDAIWYNPTTGGLTKTKPSAPNLKVQLGVVIKAGSGGSGSFQVEVDHGSVLGGTDSNVQITSPSTSQILQYNGTYWTNVTLPSNAITQTEQTATAGQTVFTVSYTVGLLVVFQNGAKLGASDFTATNGTSVTLTTGAIAGDLLVFQAYAPYSLSSATGTGNAVLQTAPTINSPTLTTPILGTPASGNLSNCTGFPAAQGSSMVLLGSASASNSASIDFTGLTSSSYSSYRVYIDCAVPTNNAVNLLLRFSSSGTFQTSGYYWQNWRWTNSGQGVAGQWGSGTGIALDAAGADNLANTANNGGSFVIDIMCPYQGSDIHRVNYQGYYLGSANLGIVGNGWSGTNTIDGIRLLMDVGNISTGRFWLYGIKNA